jgi:hypothetical protein
MNCVSLLDLTDQTQQSRQKANRKYVRPADHESVRRFFKTKCSLVDTSRSRHTKTDLTAHNASPCSRALIAPFANSRARTAGQLAVQSSVVPVPEVVTVPVAEDRANPISAAALNPSAAVTSCSGVILPAKDSTPYWLHA